MFQPRGFFLSFLFGNLLLVGTILVIGFLTIAYEVNRRASRLTERSSEQLLAMVRSDLQESWSNAHERINLYCAHSFRELDSRLTIVDTYGRVLGDSEFAPDKMESHLHERPEIAAALSGKRGDDIRLSRTARINYRYLAEPVFHDGKIVAVVRIAYPIANILENRQMLLRGVLVGFALMLIAATLLSLLLSWLWNRPLQYLNSEAKRIAEGNLQPSTGIDSPLEMAQLSQSLETMRRTVSGQLATITAQRETFQTIFHNLPDAIFAMNPAAEVIYFNEAAKKMFRIESPAERPYLQGIVRNAAIIEWYLKCRRSPHLAGTPAHTDRLEVDMFGRKHVLELEFVETGTQAKEDAAWVLVVSDLTNEVRVNKMKTDFVANASHELRTPLAAIRAAIDNVSEDVYDDKEMLDKIIQIVRRHVLRLGALLEDLLALHGAEDDTAPVRIEETSVPEQQSWIEELFRNRIDDKHIAFSVTSDCGNAPFRVDNKRLGLLLQNLLDNAVKFTPAGGTVALNFRREESGLLIECRDTGVGIAAEEQQRVFERFYQSDVSRTGDGRLRGTGLGLAIVKHAVERLKGSISLESRVAQGSVFTVRIPVEFV